MRLFTKSNNQKADFSWKPLHSLTQLDEILNTTDAVLIFKHSTRCGISKMALKNFQINHKGLQGVDFYLLDLLNHRDISLAIAEKTEVVHQSPQVIFLKNGTVVTAASQQEVAMLELSKYK